jgi:hypothetical protein
MHGGETCSAVAGGAKGSSLSNRLKAVGTDTCVPYRDNTNLKAFAIQRLHVHAFCLPISHIYFSRDSCAFITRQNSDRLAGDH